MAQEAGAPRPPGLVDSLSRLGRTALGVLRTRLEILGTELEEERIHFARLALAVAAIAFCLQMAVLLFVAFLVVLLWESHRLATLGAAAAAFLIAGVVGMLVLKRRLARRPKMFASSLGELVKDEERLK
ncbi:MAG: phage holin family protein [Burkholderiales bacterium]